MSQFGEGGFHRWVSDEHKQWMIDRAGEAGLASRGLRSADDYLQSVAEAVQQVADGDLSVEVTPRSGKDELGSAVGQMIVSLRQMVSGVAMSADSLAEASAQLDRVATQSSQASS